MTLISNSTISHCPWATGSEIQTILNLFNSNIFKRFRTIVSKKQKKLLNKKTFLTSRAPSLTDSKPKHIGVKCPTALRTGSVLWLSSCLGTAADSWGNCSKIKTEHLLNLKSRQTELSPRAWEGGGVRLNPSTPAFKKCGSPLCFHVSWFLLNCPWICQDQPTKTCNFSWLAQHRLNPEDLIKAMSFSSRLITQPRDFRVSLG